MPIYEYTCRRCRSTFEVLVRGTEVPLCPHCGGKKLDKEFSVPAAHSGTSRDLPVCEPSRGGGGCGLPQCGTGFCKGL